MVWTFNANDYEERSFPLIPEGDHRLRINDAQLGISKTSGKDMLTITFDVSGYNSNVWYYIVLDPDKVKQTNQKLGEFFAAFDIKQYDVSKCSEWIGRTGGAKLKHEDFNGDKTVKVHYLLKREKLANLPPWRGTDAVTTAIPEAIPVDDSFPFEIS